MSGRKPKIDPTKVSLAFWALNDQLGFPTFDFSIWIPVRFYPDKPGSADPVVLLRWLADTIEKDGSQTIALGPQP